jgi:hypothetical protein
MMALSKALFRPATTGSHHFVCFRHAVADSLSKLGIVRVRVCFICSLYECKGFSFVLALTWPHLFHSGIAFNVSKSFREQPAIA